MPNYTFVQDDYKHYDPLQFQMLREIGQKMTDQYNTTMAAYGEMSSKADLFEKLANDVKGKDSVAYQNYMNYANAIRQHTDLLATQGLTPSTMRNLVQAKNDYNRIIAPIEEAYNAREAEAKRQAEYMAKYPGAIFERDANKMGIDQWMKNPSYRAKSLDRETVANRAKERFAALQKKIQEFVSEHGHVDPSTMDANQVKQWVKTNIPYEYQALEKYGVSPDDVRELMLGNPRMQRSILQAIVNDTMGMYGVDTWNTDYDHYTDAQNQQNRFNIYNQVYNTIRGEAPNSVGEDKYDNKTDNITWQKDLGWARLAEQKRQFDLEMQYKKDKDKEAAKEKAKAAAQQKVDNWNMIRGGAETNDNINGVRNEEIQEATNLIIGKGLADKYKNLSYNEIADAIKTLSSKGIVYQKGKDNTVFIQNLTKKLDDYIEENKEFATRQLKQNEPKYNALRSAISATVDNIVQNNMSLIKGKISRDDWGKMSIDERAKWLMDNVPGTSIRQVHTLQNTPYITGHSTTTLKTAYDNLMSLRGSNLENMAKTGSKDSKTFNDYVNDYTDKAYNKAGFFKHKDENGNDVYINANGELVRENAIDDILDFNSDVHYVDVGGTKLDMETSADMATSLFNIQAAEQTATGMQEGYFTDDNGNPLTDDALWWFEEDQKDGNNWLDKAMKKQKFMQIIPDYNHKTGKTSIKLAFWDSDKEAKNREPQKVLHVKSKIFDQDVTYVDENGNIVYSRDAMKTYIDNMDRALHVIHDPYATKAEREQAYKAYAINNRELFAAMKQSSMEISSKARVGRDNGEGPISENVEAAYMSRSNSTTKNEDEE